MKMKKLISRFLIPAFLLFCASFPSFSEIHKTSRYGEIGFDFSGGISNNTFTVTDLLKKNLVIDLKKLSDMTPSGGFNLEFSEYSDFFINLNIKRTFKLGFYAGLSGSGNINVGKDFVDMMGRGMSVGETVKSDIDTYADLYVEAGVKFKTVIKTFHVTFNPELFLPLFYIPASSGSVTYESSSGGKIKLNAKETMEIYSLTGFSSLSDPAKLAEALSTSLDHMGFDFAFAIENHIVKCLDLGIFARIPIVPGKLNHKSITTFEASMWENNILGILNGTEDSGSSYTSSSETDDSVEFKVFRPLKIGVEGAWRPFGSWFTVYPKIALVVRDPYSSSRIFYPEFGLNLEIGTKVIAFRAGVDYENKVFNDHIGFMLNLHVLELDFATGVRGAEFINAFKGTGVYGSFGLRIGF